MCGSETMDSCHDPVDQGETFWSSAWSTWSLPGRTLSPGLLPVHPRLGLEDLREIRGAVPRPDRPWHALDRDLRVARSWNRSDAVAALVSATRWACRWCCGRPGGRLAGRDPLCGPPTPKSTRGQQATTPTTA